jgi:glycerol-3-phosphate dehydrogenase
MRLLRAYAGVRPLYEPPAGVHVSQNRALSRAHTVVDHGGDGVDNFVSIVGGKLTTYRLMAEDTVDVVALKLGVIEKCTTADEMLPGQVAGRTYWLGHRLAEHEVAGGGDAALLCECEFVTRPVLDAYLDEHWPCSIDDIRRGTRLGMGPCQGGFCTFRAAGLIAEREAAGVSGTALGGAGTGAAAGAAAAVEGPEGPILGYLRERFNGTRPIAAGRQLQELWMVLGMYYGSLGVESLVDAARGATAPGAVEVPDA